MSKRGARSCANVKPGQHNPDPEFQWKQNELEQNQERTPGLPGSRTGVSIRWWTLLGIPIPVGIRLEAKLGLSLPRLSKKAPKRVPSAKEKVWDSEKRRFV